MHTLTRAQICELTAAKLTQSIPSLPNTKALIGLDGFVDEIIAVVNKRHGAGDNYDAVKTISHLGEKIAAGMPGRSSGRTITPGPAQPARNASTTNAAARATKRDGGTRAQRTEINAAKSGRR